MKVSLAMASDHPLLGLGTGGYVQELHRYRHRAGAMYSVPNAPVETHLPYLGILAENGIIGFGILIVLIGSVIANLLSVIRQRADKFMSITAVGVLSSFAGYLVILCFLPSFTNEIGWVLMALAVVLSALSSREESEEFLVHEPQPS